MWCFREVSVWEYSIDVLWIWILFICTMGTMRCNKSVFSGGSRPSGRGRGGPKWMASGNIEETMNHILWNIWIGNQMNSLVIELQIQRTHAHTFNKPKREWYYERLQRSKFICCKPKIEWVRRPMCIKSRLFCTPALSFVSHKHLTFCIPNWALNL